ncbi:MAG TPA: beta-propeller fold lactonase family protein [Candidatus Acidoferrum sp.]|nr:beta-propeller fold lactonase family protein [Candidatus Acidoferrum sp.]
MGHNAKWKICVKFIALSLTASAVYADTPPVDLSPNSLNFGSQIVGVPSGQSAVTVTNHLSTPLTIFSVTTSGDFAQTNNCGSTLLPGHSCTVKVTFTPTAVGTRTGQLLVTDAAGTSPQATSLSGTGSVSGLASISLSPTNPTIPLGLRQQFLATGFFKNGTVSDLTTSVTWSSSNPAIATISNSTGSLGLATSSAQGTTVITASVGSVSGSTILTVTPPTLVSLSVTPLNPSIPLGATQQFSAIGAFTNGSTQDLTASVAWNSSYAAVATINSQGLANTAKQGMATIAASSGSVSASTILTVVPPAMVSIAISPLQPSIVVANTLQFTATGNFTDGSKQDLTTIATWSSSNAAVASVSNAGGSQGLANALVVGTTTISATAGALSASTQLTVTPVLVSIRVLPANGSIPLTTALQFRAIGTFDDGSQKDLTTSVSWNSADPTVATISNSAGSEGLATSVAEGTTTISASTGPHSDSTGLSVTALVPGQARFAYVANLADSTVSIYLIDAVTGQLTQTGTPLFVGQMTFPDAVAADPSGKFLYVTDKGTFHLFAYTIDPTTGLLTPIGSPVFADTPFALTVHPSGKFLFMANGPGSVTTYSIDSTGAPTFVGQTVNAAGGAISVAVDPSGKFVYTANVNGNTVSAYSVDTSTGLLVTVPGSPFPTGPNPEFVAVHPSGNFLYASNGNGQSVSAYAVDSNTGALTGIPGSPFTVGVIPEAVALDPTGKYAFVANSASNNMSALTIESTTGALQPIAGSPFPVGTSPDVAIVDPLGKFLYVVNFDSDNISVFAIDPSTGFLTSVGTMPAGARPISMTLAK